MLNYLQSLTGLQRKQRAETMRDKGRQIRCVCIGMQQKQSGTPQAYADVKSYSKQLGQAVTPGNSGSGLWTSR